MGQKFFQRDDGKQNLPEGFESIGDSNKIKVKEKKGKAAFFTRHLLEGDEQTRGGLTPDSVGRHMCQIHALLLNHVLNRMGIKSKVVGLDFRYLRITWVGLHYVAKTEDGDYADALPKSNRVINSDMGEDQVLILSPGDRKYDYYAEGERRANLRDWGAISPDKLAEEEKQFPIVLNLYEDRINKFIQENN